MLTKDSVLAYMRQDSYRPRSYDELLEVLVINEEEEQKFCKILGTLEKEGEVVRTRKNKYGLPEMMNLIKGVIRLNQRGYGILLPDEAGKPEVFVYGKKLNGAMHQDRVMVRIHQKGSNSLRPEGEVIRVIKRANKELVGTLERGKQLLQVIPDDSRQIYPIYVKPARKFKIRNGDKVLVSITSWPDANKAAEGKIIEILGRKGQPGLDVQVVIKKHGLTEVFAPGVIDEAKKVSVPVSAEEISLRRDLRDLRMVTIDGEDAKDLDDAVSILRTNKGYQLGVHIADVSHYVKEGSKLDKEAFARGTSVYLIDKVLPMLPKELSNGICSLNATNDRLAISCIMNIDDQGHVLNYDICKSVINVNERMTYTAVNGILAGDKELKEQYKDLVDDFFLMKELADILRQDRVHRGSLDFDFPESKVIVDEKSFPIEIKLLERGPGEMLIEDFMIKANEVVAEHMYWQESPILYRVHEKPDEESLLKVNNVLGVFGHKVRGNKIEPRIFQGILDDIKGKPEEQLISLVLLRSMKHARYVPQALGHFGLASRFYCHFTSPIRRYPDLIVHRVLSYILEGSFNARKRASVEKKIAGFGEHCTMQEIKAEEAERELVDIKKAQYMQQFVGEEFSARIASVQSFGFFVELGNTVEGLVHISSIIDDYYEFNDRNYTLIGTHTGKKFSIGDEVRVQLVKVAVEDAKIDFELVDG
ncbi:MAG: ribonuclease R [Syntrophomonadaceae bacterium]|nr:ribonuclease R [Syntrophomonadaceae bacterium]MDD3889233.1 ribonuclease R [Syntrophomonadaceae bacterium]MDD4549767.1 ribonuclease R [Syntrophomonadaceae bacterium]